MKRAITLLGVGLVLLFAAATAMAYDNIVDIHVNDVTGQPVAPYAVGQAVSIRGVITSEFTKATDYFTRSYIQDATGGINVYDASQHICFVIGSDVTVEGTVAFYRGATEIVPTSYVVNNVCVPLPYALTITIPQLNGTFLADYSEPNEGRLIRIQGVTITGTTDVVFASKSYTITDGVNTGTLFVYAGLCCGPHPLIGQPIPTTSFDVTGILTQYDSTSPYTSYYQISPRCLTDIVTPPTAVENTTWGRVKALFR